MFDQVNPVVTCGFSVTYWWSSNLMKSLWRTGLSAANVIKPSPTQTRVIWRPGAAKRRNLFSKATMKRDSETNGSKKVIGQVVAWHPLLEISRKAFSARG